MKTARKKSRIRHFGPVQYLRIKDQDRDFISAWVSLYPDVGFGWEWGTDGNPSSPSICLRIAHFNIFSYESFMNAGPTIFLLGFWWSF